MEITSKGNLLLFCSWFLSISCNYSDSKLDFESSSNQTRANYNEGIYYETIHFLSTPSLLKKNSLNENYRLHTEYCKGKSQCGSDNMYRNCQCDNLCQQFNDCCTNIQETKVISESFFQRHQFKCVNFNSHSGLTSALMVSKCQDLWIDNKTKQLCEDEPSARDILLSVPVSSNSYNVIFSNMYCAYCNDVLEFTFWTLESVCLNQNITDTCLIFDYKPNNTRHFRECLNTSIISTCSISDNSSAAVNDLTKKCDSEPVLLVYDQNETEYKNKYCAMCNEVDEKSLFCDPPFVRSRQIGTVHHVYNYRLLVDFNSHQYQTINNDETAEGPFEVCSSIHDELYDPVSKTCRKMYCPPTFTGIKGKCFPNKNLRNNTNERKSRCAFIKLEPHEYEVENVTSIMVLSLNRSISSSNIFRNGSDIYVCEDMFKTYARPIAIYFDVTENYVSLCGIICSIASLIITLSVYVLLPELRNVPGKNLISLMVALCLAQLLFLCSNHAVQNDAACKALAITVHYLFLASFSWMNVIAFDLFITFSQSFQGKRSGDHVSKQFCWYSLYGWLVPAAIVTAAVILDNFSITDSQFKPRYGENVCWISSKKALILFFIGPLAVFKLFDAVGFICTSFYISKSRRQGSMVRRYNVCSFLLYLKLSLIMGLTWLFAFVAAFSNNMVMWYIFIIFNTLQGVFIALSFLCTKRVKTLVRSKLERRQNVHSSSGTLMMLLNRSS